MKKCKKCEEPKPLSEFVCRFHDKTTEDPAKFEPICKKCKSEKASKKYLQKVKRSHVSLGS